MFGPIATDGMPRIRSYVDAVSYLERTKPLRGSDERPLRKRGEKHKTIRRLNDGSVACTLYNTDLVVYHPDDTVSITAWTSASSVEFIHALTPIGLDAKLIRGRFFVQAVTPGGVVWLQPGASALRFRRSNVAIGTWECVNPETVAPQYRYFVNRERSAAIRERLKPFMQWMDAIAGITGGWVAAAVDKRRIIEGPEPLKQWAASTDHGVGYAGSRGAASFLLSEYNTPEAAPEVYPILLHWLAVQKWHPVLGEYCDTVSPKTARELTEMAYRAGGAIDKAEMPFGQVPPRSKWGY